MGAKGQPRKDPREIEERFWSKADWDIHDAERCWEWRGATSWGYGRFALKHGGSPVAAHRLAYELEIGPIPEALHLDHLCRNHACVNPWHLEPVTQKINSLRGTGAPAVNAQKTACPQGHAYTLRWGRRNCMPCRTAYQKCYVRKERR